MVCTLHKHPELPYLSNKSMFLFPGCECAKKIIFPSNPRMTLIFSAFGVHNSPFSKYGSFSSKLYPMCKDIKQTNKQTKVKQTKQKQYKTKHAIKDKKIKGTPYIHYLIPPWALFTWPCSYLLPLNLPPPLTPPQKILSLNCLVRV